MNIYFNQTGTVMIFFCGRYVLYLSSYLYLSGKLMNLDHSKLLCILMSMKYKVYAMSTFDFSFVMTEHSKLLVGVEDTFQGCKCSTYVTGVQVITSSVYCMCYFNLPTCHNFIKIA